MTELFSLSKDAASFAALAAAVAGSFISLALLFLIRMQAQIQAKHLKTSEAHNHALISLMRASYEDKIADMNQRLMATEERWKDVNHLLIDGQRKRTDTAPTIKDSEISISRFFNSLGLDVNENHVDPRLVFVLTPFNQREKETYKVIKDTVQRLNFRCAKSDDEFISGPILPNVIRLIIESRFIIANINGRNSNVYYELGIAHALGKPTILISRSIDSVPFDLQSKYILLYDGSDDLYDKLRDAISHILVDSRV